MKKEDFLLMINKPETLFDKNLRDLFVACYDSGYNQAMFENTEKLWRQELDIFNAEKKYKS